MKIGKINIIYFCLFLIVFTFAGCFAKTPNPGSGAGSKPIAATVQEDVTLINVTHVVSGQSTNFTIEGDALCDLRLWTENLQYKHKTFSAGNAPGDKEGGEIYNFEIQEGDYQGFSYIINGENDCYLLIDGEWFFVTNPSNPPITE